jgi:TonB-dependent starch-binding outer membrane protein SusC
LDLGRVAGDATLRLRGAYAVGVQPRDTSTEFFFIVPPSFGPPPAPIEPEEPREGEFGLDATLGTRLELNATLFAQHTPKLIFVTTVPQPSLGTFGTTLGKMHNRGVELAARFLVVDRPSTRWRAMMTLATLRNRVSGLTAFPPENFEGAGVRDEQPFGVFLTQDITFVDANGDNLPSPSEITISEYRPIGTAVPTREASLRSELQLPGRGLVLSAALDHRGGHRAVNVFDYYQCQLNRDCRALQDPTVSLTEKVNAVAARQRGARSVYLEDAAYTRVSEVALEWTPPARFGTAFSSGVTISVEGRNLATWTSYRGPDPEVATATARRGIQALPMVPALPRTIGLRVEFAPR